MMTFKINITFLISFFCIYVNAQESNLNFKPFIHEINFTDTNDLTLDFQYLENTILNKQIVILGESGHGDGATFKIKSSLIQYLVDDLEFNTIAFEGGGFFEMYYMNHLVNEGAKLEQEIEKAWYDIWSKTRETQSLIDFITDKEDLNLLGIENQAGNFYWTHFPTILKELGGEEAFEGIEFEKFQANLWAFYSYYFIDQNSSEKFKENLLVNNLNQITENIKSIDNEHQSALNQSVKNIQSFIQQIKLNEGSYQDQNRSISLRDSMMTENVKWWLNQYPEDKIIIWTANFHAAKNLHLAQYKKDDDFYQNVKTLGERLNAIYDSKVYNMAFISSEGKSGTIYEKESHKISLDEACWENELSSHIQTDCAFIDFAKMRKVNSEGLEFNSCVLGYNSKDGQWLNIFDGLFYIRKMKPCTKKED
ncbi:MAG: erythromycin esterase family protein [Brumimicrobium sp.]